MDKLQVAFAFLTPHDETVIKSFLKILQKDIPLELLDSFKNDRKFKSIFINLNDKRSRILFEVYEGVCPYEFILVGNLEELEKEIGADRVARILSHYPKAACRPLTLKKISELMFEIEREYKRKYSLGVKLNVQEQTQKVSWFDLMTAYQDKNILLFYNKDVFLLHAGQRQIYYSPQNESEILDCIKNSAQFLIKVIAKQEIEENVAQWNLTQTFLYDTFFYILYFTEVDKGTLQKKSVEFKKKTIQLRRYPNIFSQINFFNDQKYFYKISAYLCRNRVTFDELVKNLYLQEEVALRYLYALENLNYLNLSALPQTQKQESSVSNVGSIFSKLKKIMGLQTA